MRLVFIGPPGVGKGTQSERLVRYLGILPLSTGEMLRQACADQTELGRHMTPELVQQMMSSITAAGKPAFEFKTIPQGAATSVWAATAPGDLVGGTYCEDCHVAELQEEGRGGVRGYAIDPARADALWALSEKMVGERF